MGKWVLVSQDGVKPRTEDLLVITIEQSLTSLFMNLPYEGRIIRRQYRLDSQPVENVGLGGESGAPVIYRSHWEGAKLVTEISSVLPGQPQRKTTISFDQAGRLVIRTELVGLAVKNLVLQRAGK